MVPHGLDETPPWVDSLAVAELAGRVLREHRADRAKRFSTSNEASRTVKVTSSIRSDDDAAACAAKPSRPPAPARHIAHSPGWII